MKLPMDIDIQFDMRIDGGNDPDRKSATLRKYHQILWSRELPNGKVMNLVEKKDNYGNYYLEQTGTNQSFSSDTLTNCFKKHVKKKVEDKKWEISKKEIDDLYEEYQRICNTIGGFIIFPIPNSINVARGFNKKKEIHDRIDLTLECIRRYYCKKKDSNFNEENPLWDVLKANSDFFDLFIDFKRYVKFFFLQDLLKRRLFFFTNYKKVKIIFGDANFDRDGFNPLPTIVEKWKKWRNSCIDFVRKRNKRILRYIHKCETKKQALILKSILDVAIQQCKRRKIQQNILFHGDIADFLSRQYDYLVNLDATAVQNVFKNDMDKYKNYLKNIKSIK